MAMKAPIALAFIALLTGCASTTYFHPRLASEGERAHQLAIDDARCTAVSVGAAPMPQVTYSAPQTGYRVQGTIQNATPGAGYNSYNSYNYSGTITPQGSAAGSFAQGFANGMNMGAAIEAGNARRKIHHGCMLNLGWTTEKPQAEVAKASPAPAPKTRTPEEEKWSNAIETFMDVEAASPGGIDYRSEPAKLNLLDITVKALANDPKNTDKSMSWFLIEANRLVKAAYRHVEAQQ